MTQDFKNKLIHLQTITTTNQWHHSCSVISKKLNNHKIHNNKYIYIVLQSKVCVCTVEKEPLFSLLSTWITANAMPDGSSIGTHSTDFVTKLVHVSARLLKRASKCAKTHIKVYRKAIKRTNEQACTRNEGYWQTYKHQTNHNTTYTAAHIHTYTYTHIHTYNTTHTQYMCTNHWQYSRFFRAQQQCLRSHDRFWRVFVDFSIILAQPQSTAPSEYDRPDKLSLFLPSMSCICPGRENTNTHTRTTHAQHTHNTHTQHTHIKHTTEIEKLISLVCKTQNTIVHAKYT